MSRKTLWSLTVATTLALAGCSADKPEEPTPQSTPASTTTTSTPAPVRYPDPASLPNVENTDINRTDPTNVAYNFVLLSTTFMPGDVFNPLAASERGYPLSTKRYRTEHAPASNTEVARIRGWWNQKASETDPVAVVDSDVTITVRPSPITPDATTATRHLRSTQTPVTESGRKLPMRGQNAVLTLVKQENGTWLVDAATYEVSTR